MWLLLAKLAGILTTAVTALQPAITTAEEHVEAKLGVLHRHWTLLKTQRIQQQKSTHFVTHAPRLHLCLAFAQPSA